ncbi:MAG: proprotein convertase P-domain-containing protein [Planctomycetota bacterium]|jgi:subtilisin-like proprotein convertase family protein
MDTRKLKQRIVALLAVLFASVSPAHADLTMIYTGQFDLPIPAPPHTGDAWMDDAVINVPQSFDVIDLDVEINLTHTCIFDLQLFLEAPDGTRMALNYYDPDDEFFEGENYTGTIFDDQADTPINSAAPPFTGRFKPRPPAQLSIFNATDPQGQWKVQIYDAWHANTGTLEEVKLIFTVPEPAALLLLLAGMTLTRCTKHDRTTPENR